MDELRWRRHLRQGEDGRQQPETEQQRPPRKSAEGNKVAQQQTRAGRTVLKRKWSFAAVPPPEETDARRGLATQSRNPDLYNLISQNWRRPSQGTSPNPCLATARTVTHPPWPRTPATIPDEPDQITLDQRRNTASLTPILHAARNLGHGLHATVPSHHRGEAQDLNADLHGRLSPPKLTSDTFRNFFLGPVPGSVGARGAPTSVLNPFPVLMTRDSLPTLFFNHFSRLAEGRSKPDPFGRRFALCGNVKLSKEKEVMDQGRCEEFPECSRLSERKEDQKQLVQTLCEDYVEGSNDNKVEVPCCLSGAPEGQHKEVLQHMQGFPSGSLPTVLSRDKEDGPENPCSMMNGDARSDDFGNCNDEALTMNCGEHITSEEGKKAGTLVFPGGECNSASLALSLTISVSPSHWDFLANKTTAPSEVNILTPETIPGHHDPNCAMLGVNEETSRATSIRRTGAVAVGEVEVRCTPRMYQAPLVHCVEDLLDSKQEDGCLPSVKLVVNKAYESTEAENPARGKRGKELGSRKKSTRRSGTGARAARRNAMMEHSNRSFYPTGKTAREQGYVPSEVVPQNSITSDKFPTLFGARMTVGRLPRTKGI